MLGYSRRCWRQQVDGLRNIGLPAETPLGKRFRLRGKGVRSIRIAQQGDLFCRVMVEIPVNLSEAQKQQLKDFDDSLHADDCDHSPQTITWFSKVKRFFKHN